MKSLLLSLLLALPILSFAQSNFHKGYILTNSADTVKGYVDYKEREENPSSVIFKPGLESKPKVYTLESCTGYGIDGFEKYQRAIVRVSLSTTEISHLSAGRDSSSKLDTVFLRVIQRGKKVAMFSYKDGIKMRYYLQDRGDSAPYELIRQVYLAFEASSTVITKNTYANQLLLVMQKYNADTEVQRANLERLPYNESDILKIVSLINGEKIVKPIYSRTRFFIGSGVTSSKAGYTGTDELATNSQSKSSVMPVFTAGIDFFLNPAIGKLIFRLELSYISNKSDISKHTDDMFQPFVEHVFNQKSVSLTPQIIYNIYNSNSLKVFIEAGAAFSHSSYTDDRRTYTDIYGRTQQSANQIYLNSFNVSFPATVGVVLAKKVEVSAGYYFPFQLSNYEQTNVTMQRYKLGVNYLFGKH